MRFLRSLYMAAIAALAAVPAGAAPGDITACLAAADKVQAGNSLSEPERSAAHEACRRALSDSSNVVMKYHLQEADFDIMGRPPR
jgi:hypothetical protein